MNFGEPGRGDPLLAQMQADDLAGRGGRGPKWDREVWWRLALALTPIVLVAVAIFIVSR